MFDASQALLEFDGTPVVNPPAEIAPAARPPRACILCLDQMATVVALPCRHALYCSDCNPGQVRVCDRCNAQAFELMDVLLT